MAISGPYSSRLARGTLLMMHLPTVEGHYTRIRRCIFMESAALAGSGLLMGFAGLMGDSPQVIFFSVLLLLFAFVGMVWRCIRVRYRQRRTPRLLFVAEEGICGIMPDRSSLTLPWPRIRAREVRYQRRLLPFRFFFHGSDRNGVHGVVVRDSLLRRLYLTHDLEGYNDLIDIMMDYDVPIASAQAARFNLNLENGTWRRQLHGRSWQERN